MAFIYPHAKTVDNSDNYHGTVVEDPYRWLEDGDSEDTKQYIAEQNELSTKFINAYPYKDTINSNITKMWNFPKHLPPFKEGEQYYQMRNTGLQNQSVIYTFNSDITSPVEVFFDPNELKDAGCTLTGTSFTRDGSTMAYGLSKVGSDWVEIHFLNVCTREDYPDVLTNIKFSTMAWMNDNSGFFYSAYLNASESGGNELINQKLFYHRLNTKQCEDMIVAKFDDPHMLIEAELSDCYKYLIVSTKKSCKDNLLYYTKLDDIHENMQLTQLIDEMNANFVFICNNEDRFIIQTNRNAPNYKVIVLDINRPAEEFWVDLIAQHPTDVLDFIKATDNDKLIACYLKDCSHRLIIYNMNGTELQSVQEVNTEFGTIFGLNAKRSESEIFYGFASFTSPTKIFCLKFDNDKIENELFYNTVVEGLKPEEFTVKQEFYESKDGTRIPLFIVHNSDFTEESPCLLYGYGGFGATLTPSFSVFRLLFIKNFNGVFALANVRGGGEYGDRWHNAGRFESKQNSFDDFQAAAQYLAEKKYTKASKLAILGGSNGGLLVTTCMNQAPQLFGAAIAQVGVLDMLRFHKFNIGFAWKSDYGSSESPDDFKNLIKYSPLHNVKVPDDEQVQYPATLLLTADHDERVVACHSLKFIAELQAKIGGLSRQNKPLMVRIDTKSEDDSRLTNKVIDETTEILCFIAKTLDLEYAEI